MNLSRKGRDRLQATKDEYIEQFDSRAREVLYELDAGDEALIKLTEAVGRAHYAHDQLYDRDRDRDENPAYKHTAAAIDDLEAALDARVAECVADECATIISEADDWHWDADQIAAARHEAREWLQVNRDVAKRAGVWQEVTA